MKHYEKYKGEKLLTGTCQLEFMEWQEHKGNNFFTFFINKGQDEIIKIMMFQNEYIPLIKCLLGIPDDEKVEEWDDEELKNKRFQADLFITKYKGKEYQKMKNYKKIEEEMPF